MNQTPILLGHEAKWRALRRAFARDQIPQTMLITGPAQVGKWTLALRFAQLLLCPHSMENEGDLPAPCGVCRTCHQVEIETFPDFRVCRPIVSKTNPVTAPEALDSSRILMESARDFFTEATYRPTVGPRKVMILQQADRMNENAQNSLLKTFEEPIEGLKIVLLTDQPAQLLDTIRSRCWELPLGVVSQREMRAWLQNQWPNLTPEAIERVLLRCAGRPGRAKLAAEQEIAAASCGGKVISRADELAQFMRRIETGVPVGALKLSEDAQVFAERWGEEDQINRVRVAGNDSDEEGDKKLARALVRAQLMRFLDELSNAYRMRWHRSLNGNDVEKAAVWASGLDQIRKTRHYILRNANANLALDALFLQLIGAQRAAKTPTPRTQNVARR